MNLLNIIIATLCITAVLLVIFGFSLLIAKCCKRGSIYDEHLAHLRDQAKKPPIVDLRSHADHPIAYDDGGLLIDGTPKVKRTPSAEPQQAHHGNSTPQAPQPSV